LCGGEEPGVQRRLVLVFLHDFLPLVENALDGVAFFAAGGLAEQFETLCGLRAAARATIGTYWLKWFIIGTKGIIRAQAKLAISRLAVISETRSIDLARAPP